MAASSQGCGAIKQLPVSDSGNCASYTFYYSHGATVDISGVPSFIKVEDPAAGDIINEWREGRNWIRVLLPDALFKTERIVECSTQGLQLVKCQFNKQNQVGREEDKRTAFVSVTLTGGRSFQELGVYEKIENIVNFFQDIKQSEDFVCVHGESSLPLDNDELETYLFKGKDMCHYEIRSKE